MHPLAARSLVFFTSAAVLVLEIMAGRLLAPFLGVTIETFTGIIGTVLAGIAVGNWLGGRAADRFDPARLLGPLLILGGISAALTAPLVAIVGASMRAAGPVEIVALTAVAFFVPAAVLSAVTPTVVKLQLQDLARTGRVVGTLGGVATAGAIFGTFVTGFLLIAALPSRPIIFVLGAVLSLVGAILSIRVGMRTSGVAVGLMLTAAAGLAVFAVHSPCDEETAYFCVMVTADPERPTGRVLWLDTLRHSYVDLEDPSYLGFRYSRLMDDAISATLEPGPLRAAYIGGGGFTLPRYLSATRPGSTNDVLELDPGIVQIAHDSLGLTDRSDIHVRTGDARISLSELPESSYDLVVGDAFGGTSVPWHLTTVEFVTEIQELLGHRGIYTLNLIDYPPNEFARAEAATLLQVFDHVAVIAPHDYLDGVAGGNFVLVGSDSPIDGPAIEGIARDRGAPEITIVDDDVREFAGGARSLRDEFAPVDQLISQP